MKAENRLNNSSSACYCHFYSTGNLAIIRSSRSGFSINIKKHFLWCLALRPDLTLLWFLKRSRVQVPTLIHIPFPIRKKVYLSRPSWTLKSFPALECLDWVRALWPIKSITGGFMILAPTFWPDPKLPYQADLSRTTYTWLIANNWLPIRIYAIRKKKNICIKYQCSSC